MREWLGTEATELRGSTPGNNGLHPFDGGGDGDGSITKTQSTGDGAGGTGREGNDAVSQKTWFDAVEEISDCPGGVCPVPWAKTVEAMSESAFLSSDRNSNFPNENTIEKAPVIQKDQVNHPSHYTEGGLECIEAIEAQLTPEEYRGYLKGNIAKYIWREKHKGGTESLKKANWYLERLIGFDDYNSLIP